MATLAHWMVALAQGLPFFHAGDELLRSKSLDRDSYDSGALLVTFCLASFASGPLSWASTNWRTRTMCTLSNPSTM